MSKTKLQRDILLELVEHLGCREPVHDGTCFDCSDHREFPCVVCMTLYPERMTERAWKNVFEEGSPFGMDREDIERAFSK